MNLLTFSKLHSSTELNIINVKYVELSYAIAHRYKNIELNATSVIETRLIVKT